MRFWDSSALVPLLAGEASTRVIRTLYTQDADVIVWWATPLECASAVARLEREGALSATDAATAFARLDALAAGWLQVEPTDEVREIARRLLRVHPLRAADALQLAAGFVAAERRPSTMGFVTLDEKLSLAAGKEGFVVSEIPRA